jgi:hypothetical protein
VAAVLTVGMLPLAGVALVVPAVLAGAAVVVGLVRSARGLPARG